MVILYCAAVACNSSAQSANKPDGEMKTEATSNGSPASDGEHKDSMLVLVATEEQLARRYSLRPESEHSPSGSKKRSSSVKRSVSSVGDYGKRHVSRHQKLNQNPIDGQLDSDFSSSSKDPKRKNVGRSASSASAYGKRRNRRESTFSFVTDFRYSDGRKASSLSLDHLDHVGRLSRGNSTNSRQRNSLSGEEQLERTPSQKRSSPAVRASPLLLI